ncbi:hypothetical protein [Pedobacter sp.]|uniref:hypothetical protein n=1 Tax=Pedobacter sp. TaxID=1411316 RepID=UPI003D7F6C45
MWLVLSFLRKITVNEDCGDIDTNPRIKEKQAACVDELGVQIIIQPDGLGVVGLIYRDLTGLVKNYIK